MLLSLQIGGGNLQPGGHWSGVMGDLTEGRADLALFPLALTSQRDKVISHTAALMNDGFGIVVPQQQVSPSLTLPCCATQTCPVLYLRVSNATVGAHPLFQCRL